MAEWTLTRLPQVDQPSCDQLIWFMLICHSTVCHSAVCHSNCLYGQRELCVNTGIDVFTSVRFECHWRIWSFTGLVNHKCAAETGVTSFVSTSGKLANWGKTNRALAIIDYNNYMYGITGKQIQYSICEMIWDDINSYSLRCGSFLWYKHITWWPAKKPRQEAPGPYYRHWSQRCVLSWSHRATSRFRAPIGWPYRNWRVETSKGQICPTQPGWWSFTGWSNFTTSLILKKKNQRN